LLCVDLMRLELELAAAAFLGIEVLAQNGREIDLDRLAATMSAAVQLLGGGIRAS
jgi:hypothetical protein